MNKAQFIDQVAEKAGMSRAAAARAVEAVFDTASGAVSQAVHSLGELSIPGFGKFTKKTRAARQGRNPRTGAVIDIPERSTISFTAGKNLREGTASGRRKPAEAATAPAAKTPATATKPAKSRAASTAGGGGARGGRGR
ncbi:MAG TPA: HU family DNA-binding protein [Longimicrobium sp.]|nr:HU family DNA-binding protein [Longimicrobium sp.]